MAWSRDADVAQDLTQEVLLRAYLHLRTGKSIHNFAAWCCTVARNLALNWLRGGKRRSALLEKMYQMESPMNDVSKKLTPREAVQRSEEASRLQHALDQLQPALREVVILHYLEGCSRSEVARITNQHPSSVGRAIERALREMRLGLTEATERIRCLRHKSRLGGGRQSAKHREER